jgi:hypothetical protein
VGAGWLAGGVGCSPFFFVLSFLAHLLSLHFLIHFLLSPLFFSYVVHLFFFFPRTRIARYTATSYTSLKRRYTAVAAASRKTDGAWVTLALAALLLPLSDLASFSC